MSYSKFSVSRATVLVVDDTPSNLMLLNDLLKDEYTIKVANCGERALKIAQSDQPPDLILLDIMMPVMDGYDVCRQLKENEKTKNIPVIFVTAMSDISAETQGFELGAVDYITKPISPPIVLARVKTHLKLQMAYDELRRHQDHLEFERQFIEKIITRMRATKWFDTRHLRFLLDPVEKTAGDILLAAFRPDGAQHILLGDFTGHGLPAAIGGPLVSDIFYTMTKKGLSSKEIMAEINERLHEKTPTEMFMVACLLELDPSRTQLTVWNCSIPDILVYRDCELFMRISSGSLPMGVVPQFKNPNISLNVHPNDRIYAYSDGFIEERNTKGDMFGQTNLEQRITRMLQMNEPIQVIQATLMEYRTGHEQADDMTMVEVVC